MACPLHSTSASAAASIAQCQCVADYEPGPRGCQETGRPCVATYGVGQQGSKGTCGACPKGSFKNTIGTVCSSCPGSHTVSCAGATSSSKCLCLLKQVGIKKGNVAFVESLGAWDVIDTLLQTSTAGEELVYEPSASSPRIWKLVVAGPADFLCVCPREPGVRVRDVERMQQCGS